MTEYARPRDADDLVQVLRRRKAELGLSNSAIDDVCGFAGGITDKLIGPSATKMLVSSMLLILLQGLGLRLVLVIDEEPARRLWDRAGRRSERNVRITTESPRLSKVLIKRAAPEVRRISASLAAHAKWKKTTADVRNAHCAMMRNAKRKRFARKAR